MKFQTSKTRDIRRIGHLALLVICATAGCRTIDDRLADATTAHDIAQAVADYYVQDADDESCAVAVVHSNGVVFASAGSADEHALFRIASLSKLFLHPVLLKLHDEGRINLDRPVSSVSKLDLPPEYGCITLRDLLLNHSGMIYGGASFVGFDPKTRTIVVILRNVTSWPDKRGFAVMERILNLP